MRPLRNTDDIARMLETTGQYRILKRVRPVDPDETQPPQQGAFLGVALDCEATGVDPLRSEPIEVAAVKFAYADDGILHPIDIFEQLQEPSQPLDPAVSRLVGLTDADLAGRRIDRESLKAFLAPANLICAHHARYDRALLEHWMPDLPLRPWACTMTNIDWTGTGGLTSRRLGDILYANGLFNDAHRALHDVESLMAILQLPLPGSDRNAFRALLASARRCTAVVFAEGSPIAKRGILKTRGYRWANGESGEPRSWWCEIDGGGVRQEFEFLVKEVYDGGQCPATVTLVSALHRFRPLAQIAAVRTPPLPRV